MRLLACLIVSFGLLAATAPAMDMGSPEHVAEALVALKAHKNASAKMHLKEAIATKAEPPCARRHAREALGSVKAGKRGAAIEHATNGAACEHLTFAVNALQAGDKAMARDHLTEASRLKPYKQLSEAALSELKAGRVITATALARKALLKAKDAD